jgi:hypothetical protein
VRLRIQALRALRLNYTRRGVWVWLRGRKRSTGERGWRMVWRDPQRVIERQEQAANGNAS